MSGRLASFKGPSTPAPSPAKAKQVKSPSTPQSPARSTESTYHRKLRTLLEELRTVTENWDDIVLLDGFKTARALVDGRTDLEFVSSHSRCTQAANSRYISYSAIVWLPFLSVLNLNIVSFSHSWTLWMRASLSLILSLRS